MLKTLTRDGEDAVLVIDHTILELINADINTTFDITTDGKSLILTPVTDAERLSAVRTSVERIGKRYAKTFEELSK